MGIGAALEMRFDVKPARAASRISDFVPVAPVGSLDTAPVTRRPFDQRDVLSVAKPISRRTFRFLARSRALHDRP